MSDLFLKALECSCVKGTSATCPAGGEVSATLSSSPANLSVTVESEARIFSPQAPASCNDAILSVSGSGPFYLVTTNDSCPEINTDSLAQISADGETYYYNIISINNDGITLEYDNSTDASDRQIEIGDSIQFTTYLDTTLPDFIRTRAFPQVIESDSEVDAPIAARLNFDLDAFLAEGELEEDMLADYSVGELMVSEGEFTNTVTDKIHGSFSDYYCQQVLYPSGDLDIDEGFGSFIAVFNQSGNLYSYIDEGVYQGLLKDRGDSILLSDDANSFIHPNTIHTEGFFQYKCALTELYVRPDDSYLRMRVSAPTRNYESRIAPLYTVYNIRLNDPSGNLVIKYEDFVVKGDSDQEHPNYTTYSTAPEINVLSENYDWDRRSQPHMHEVSGYYLSFNIRAVALDDAFDEGFSEGFEENYIIPETFNVSGNNYLALDGSPLSTQEERFINPTDGFRISALEICNSGGVGFGYRLEDTLSFYTEVPETGRRLERQILPSFMPISTFDTSIWPSVSSVWESSLDPSVTNLDKCGAEELIKIITNNGPSYITLNSMGGDDIADSGKLTVKFSYGASRVDEVTLGAFNSDFDQNTESIWFSPSGAFNTENKNIGDRLRPDLSFVDIDTLTLKVVAKKAASTRDYILDVVGYSDDKLLNVTPASGGFIQDPSGVVLNDLFVPNVGQHPVLSGFYGNGNDLALGGTAISQKEQYYQASGNDHYKLAQYPTVTGTEFETYEIPLAIIDENLAIGKGRDFSLSSLFEHVYLDIFPLPSGASIREISLCARYRPQNALQFYTQGGEELGKTQDGRSEAALFPSGRQSNDSILNAGSGYAPISTIEGLPHAFTSPETIKTNYARRWRGREGSVRGPYDIDEFSFAFENPLLDYPFLSGYYKFDSIDTGYVKSVSLGEDGYGTVSGLIVGDLEVYQNLGWRLASGTLFQDAMPGFSGNYTTTDWTSLSNGSTTFFGNPLYGKIADAFDRVVRISGESQNINFGNIDTASGFSVFARFTPDVNVSGADYDLFESGILFAKWDTPEQLDFALAYSGGYLCGYAQDDIGNIIKVVDTVPYSGYQFPLNVILTYNDHNQSGLKLYTDNEFWKGEFPVLRASGGPFYKNTTDADLVLGFGAGSGVGMNMLVSEFGISTWSSGIYGSGTNIVESNADKSFRQVTAEDFLINSRVKFFDPDESASNDAYKLWDRVNEDTYNDWYLGAFQNCMFSSAYDEWQVRPSMEQIVFEIKHHGSGYIQYADLPAPSAVDSGVAYHTQIENDFLRFHLTDVPDNFYAVNKRITKSLPVGYKFSEKALVVESVIKHDSSGSIVWPDCDSPEGPRLIVSLYTQSKEPYWTTDEPNWGLVNRKIHYVPPSACIYRFDSTFTYDDICDTSEQWAIFPEEPRIREFGETYFSDDVNDMFVQYDLVYPSGPAFESRLEMHSSHIRMADANILALDDSGVMNLYASGGFPATEFINLVCGEIAVSGTESLPLLIGTPLPLDNLGDTSGSGFFLMTSGAIQSRDVLPLFTPLQSGVEYLDLFISGQLPDSGASSVNLAMPYTLGFFDTSNDADPGTTPGDENRGTPGGGSGSPAAGGPGKDAIVGGQPAASGASTFFGLPMILLGETGLNVSGDVPLYVYATNVGVSGAYANTPLTLWNNFNNTETTSDSGVLNLTTRSIQKITSRFRNASMPLYISAPLSPSAILPLFIDNYNIPVQDTSSINLMTASYPVGSKGIGSAYGLWDNNNYGTGIEIEDNRYATVAVDNEIRGIDFAAYGSCTGDSPSKAVDSPLATDCTVWREETCNDGGIFRANQTYTNSGALGFDGVTPGYSGNYYGLRKYTQLLPALNYNAVVTVKTGSTDPIPVPRTFEEWEYGMCGPAWDADGCCTEDCDQNVVFSGVKLIGDDACGVPPSSNLCVDPAEIIASGRHEYANYGKAVAVKDDLMAVSAPNQTIPEYDFYADTPSMIDVSGAGSVFLYRRGEDVAGKKASWELTTQLMLPTGYRKDYPQRTIENLLTFDDFTISGVKWQIGQEGRQFGESVDLCSSGDREVVVVGAPRAKWSREFSDIVTSGIPTAAIVFADRFSYNRTSLNQIAATARRFDILWKYFSAPWYADEIYGGTPAEFQAQIDTKILVVQPSLSQKDKDVVPTDQSSWFKHVYVPRLDDYDLVIAEGSGVYADAGQTGTEQQYFNSGLPVVFSNIVSGVQDAFFELFPSGRSDVLYSGIPAIVGLFQEQSSSSLGGLTYVDLDGTERSIYKEFEEFYLSYSYNSGVFNQITGNAESGHLNVVQDRSEDWAATTQSLIYETFDSGRLATTYTNTTLNQYFITSGVGQEFAQGYSINEFQIAPASGGRVYIFENERGNFNCIQQIISPNDLSDIYSDLDDWYLGNSYSKEFNDRFGHSVSISQNGEIISVGSPFLTSQACQIFERSESENARVYSRVRDFANYINRTDAVSHYDDILALSGAEIAQQSTYDNMFDAGERFKLRIDVNFWGSNLPETYTKIYDYGYNDIEYVGTRKFLVDEFAAGSRLGWSTATSDQGDIVAFGAPTDSLNQFEDVNVWGDDESSWGSYHNAGAVRVFESRKYHPHDKVVEFGLFGNLDRSFHKEERDLGYYDIWDQVFASGADGTTAYQGHDWRRTDFSEIEIPADAGLAFIITPELDAASDEVIDNIKNWLALGDRNLVIVGNDPVWEENGLYAESNDIVNKILSKLGSRMKIMPAKNKQYSLQGCVSVSDVEDDKFNVTRSLLPQNSTGRTVGTGNYYGKGFGDIRINLEADGYADFEDYMECPEGLNGAVINRRCELPLKHLGDLRAQWAEECESLVGGPLRYAMNWPTLFETYTPSCKEPPATLFRNPGREPVPVLTTAETLPDRPWFIPESSGLISDQCPIYAYRTWTAGGNPRYEFGDNHIDGAVFDIYENSNAEVSGSFVSFDQDTFFNPEAINGRDALIQASAVPRLTGFNREKFEEVYDAWLLAVAESGKKDSGELNNSRVYIIASQWSEDDASRGIDDGTDNDDKNTEFYLNLVTNNCSSTAGPRGIQINGFTGRTSLNNAYFYNGDNNDGHSLANKFRTELGRNNSGGYFQENKDTSHLTEFVDFAWIAHPSGKPSDVELTRIKNWMNKGDKRLIITYNAANPDDMRQVASNVDYLCSGLNISSRPFYLPSLGSYVTSSSNKIDSWRGPGRFDEVFGDKQIVNSNSDTLQGCPAGYAYNNVYNDSTAVSGLHFSERSSSLYDNPTDNIEYSRKRMIPISGGGDYERIISFTPAIFESVSVPPILRYDINASATFEFDTVPDSGYRIFFDWVSESDQDKYPLEVFISNVSSSPVSGVEGFSQWLRLEPTNALEPNNLYVDCRSTDETITVRVFSNQFINEDEVSNDGSLYTTRLLAISGALLPIDVELTPTFTGSGLYVEKWEECNQEWVYSPASSGVIPGEFRPVKHQSDIYCGPGNQPTESCDVLGLELIEDGPVVAAEEFENFSSFPAGARRSKIIVISDSTMLQGQCPHYRYSALNGNQEFIRSLYPDSPNFTEGRNFSFTQKLRAPERGSAAKYYAVSGVSNTLSPLYGGNGIVGSLGNYTGDEDQIDPTTLSRPVEIISEQQIKARKIAFYNDECDSRFGAYPRFSGDFLDINNYLGGYADYDGLLGLPENINRDFIVDMGIGGGLTELMKINNTDYLDLDVYYSGCLGDLFGYSIDITDDKLIVGAPFNAFEAYSAVSGVSGIVQWHEIQNGESGSGIRIAEDGGAGAAFIYHRTGSGENIIEEFLPWEFISKLKPSSLNVGVYDFSPDPRTALNEQRNIDIENNPDFILDHGKRSDNFGLSVSIDCDMAAIGAPNHDYETLHHHIYSGAVALNGSGLSTAFLRKSFNGEFDIPTHSFYDLGSSGVRVDDFGNNSGVNILNNGAVFNYRHELTDFQAREQTWQYAQKLVAEGYNDRTATGFGPPLPPDFENYITSSGTENDNFGRAVAIDRAFRGDGDYTMVVGSPNHHWPTSGDHPTSGLTNAGAGYTFDAMLREQIPAIPNSGGWIDVKVFGDGHEEPIFTRVYQNTSGDSLSYQVSGIVTTNINGDVFLEVSGFDPSVKGFIAHRPYVESVQLQLATGITMNDSMQLFINGKPVEDSGILPLVLSGDPSAIVYNSVNLYNFGVSGAPSGGMNLFLDAPSGYSSGTMNLVIGNQYVTDSLELRIRGY